MDSASYSDSAEMGELVSGAAILILEKLATKAFENVSLGWGLKADIKRLQGSMKIISDFLLDGESKKTENQAITEWLKQLKDAFYDASDIVDELDCEALRNRVVETHAGISRKVGRFFSSSNSLAFRYKMVQKIKDVKERIDDIASDRIQFGLSQHRGDNNMPLMPWRETHSFVQSSRVIGREKEKEEIIRFLMSPQLWVDEIDVMPIVGIGGLGKTKLAQLVYNDEQVKELFQLRMWVYVSDKFDLRRLTLKILQAANYTIPDHQNYSLDQLQSLLRKELSAKNFLLVLDDVWNESSKRWHELRDLFMGTQNNSKIIVTTRSHKVASIMGTVPQLELKELGEEESLKLFVRCAFPTGEEKKHPTLAEMGKEIVKKCKGVPLAVETLGSQLFAEVSENKWRKIRDSEIWKIDEHNDGIMPALRLSYNHLPTHLKQCFSYCSIYPKDYHFDSVELVAFWMAHGLLLPSNTDEEPEDVGELNIDELISRCFFQIQDYKNCFIRVIKMHHLFHDLAMSTMQSEEVVVSFGLTSRGNNINEHARHISFSTSEGVQAFPQGFSKARTLGFWHSIDKAGNITELSVKWISSEFKYLRVLDIQNSTLKSLPDCFGKMKHLRYLNLFHCKMIRKLPNSICKLQNLQYLGLGYCRALDKLPIDVKNLVSLRMLVLGVNVGDLSQYHIGCYKSLQALYIYDSHKLLSLPCELGHLTALKRLLIWNCSVASFEDKEEDEENEVKYLSLQLLAISDLPKLVALPRWLKKSAKTLQCIRLARCFRLTALPEWLPNLTSLETLIIDYCPKLSSFPSGMDMFRKHHKLEITNCPKLVAATCKQNTSTSDSAGST